MVDRLAVRSYTVKALGCQEKVVLVTDRVSRRKSVVDASRDDPLEWPSEAPFPGRFPASASMRAGVPVKYIASVMSCSMPTLPAATFVVTLCFYDIRMAPGRRTRRAGESLA